MPSPFPGMNPFLENSDPWEDFHQSYVRELRDQIVAQIGPQYIVKMEAHIYVHELSAAERGLIGKSDVGITDLGGRSEPRPQSSLASAPYSVQMPAVEFEKSSYIEIRDKERRSLITVIELLSPTNKRPGPDRESYLAKRSFLLYKDVHFIEIDFLRGWPRMPIPDLPACSYCVLLRRAVQWPPVVGVWPIQLREPLPTIPVPLREPDPDASLDLQKALHAVYDAAGYANYIYLNVPYPPLSAEDEAWVKEVVGKTGAR